MNETEPKTLLEAVKHFADLDTCQAYMLAIKWPDGRVTCPACSSDNIGTIATRKLLKCRACKKQFSAKTGTIFEDSPLPLSTWFVAVWLIANAKNGVSSYELGRALGVQQRTAWFMLHRIRLAMRTGTFRKMSGEVESDETYVGGKAENMHAQKRARKISGRGGVGKAIVHGLLERGTEQQCSKVRASVIPNTDTLISEVVRNVERGSHVYTDAAPVYGELSARDFWHRWVDHGIRYVRDRIHTNGLENFFSLLKRMLRGTYVAVAPFHLFRYLDEETFRFNERRDADGDAGRFARVMRGVTGRRITYRELCAIDDAGFMGIA